MEDTNTSTKLNFLNGGGEMGKLIRSKDWSQTPLGSPDTWPQSLRTAVSLCIASNFPIDIVWGSGRVQIYNDGYWPITGDKHPASMGQDFKECWLPAWPVIGQAFEEASLGETRYLENQRIFIDRYGYLEETFFTFSFSPILDESGGVGGLFHPVVELTQQTLAERRLNILRALGESTVNAKTVPEAIALILDCLKEFELDLPFLLLYAIAADGNEANLQGSIGVASDLPISPAKLNLQSEQTETWPLSKLLQSEKGLAVDGIEKIFGSFSCGPYAEAPEQAMIFPLTIPGVSCNNYLLVVGVSSRRRLDEKYLLFYDLLAGSITNALTKARAYEEERKKAESLAEIDKAKTIFFSNISHEFRTPLTLMLSPLEELLTKKNNSFSEIELGNIKTTHRNAIRLLKLVNTLLDYSSIESGRVQVKFSLVDIVTLTKNLASNFRSVIEKAGLELIVKADSIIQPTYVDVQMWEKIVFNLLSNAFKYTWEGEISIELSSEQDFVVLKVGDTGVGIPEAELPKMFERFHRIQSITGRTYEGTGIGLSLIKELVHMHQGTIDVESKLNKGSVFTVKIPTGKKHISEQQISTKEIDTDKISSALYVDEIETLLDSGKKELAKVAALAEKNTFPTILVVDDNADMRENISSILSTCFNVITASNGLDALHKITESKPTIVLSDIMMPVMDGIGLLKEIRSHKGTENIPVIFLTARAGEESRIEGWETGADDYLVKPFSSKELLARINAQLNIIKLRESLESNIRNLFMDAPAVICVLKGPTHVYEIANKVYLNLIGKKDVIGKTVKEVLPELEDQGFFELLDTVYTTGKPFIGNEIPAQLDMGNGKLEEVYMNFVYQPAKNSKGEIDGILVHGVEVTEQVLARRKIEESERSFSNLLMESPFAFAILKGEDMVVSLANDALKQVWGKGKDIEGKALLSIIPEIKDQGFAELLNQVYQTGKPFYGHEELVKLERNGTWEDVYFNFIYQPYKEAGETISGVTIIANEVTTQAMANKSIVAAKENVSRMFMQAPAAICVLRGPNHVFELTNEKYLELVGKRDMLGKSVREALPELVGQGFYELLDKVYATGESFIGNEMPIQLIKANGKLEDVFLNFVYQASNDSAGEIIGILVHAVDVTQQVLARKKIEESEQRFKNLIYDASAAIVVLTGPEMKIEVVNKAWGNLIERTPEELINRLVFEFTPENEAYYLPLLNKVYTTGEKVILHDSPYTAKKDNKTVEGFLHIVYEPYRDENRKIVGVMVICQDVTESVMTRKKIELSEKKFEAAISAVEGIIWTNNAFGEMQGEQLGWARLTGQSHEEYQGHGWSKVIHPEDVQNTLDAWNVALEKKTTFVVEHRVKTKEKGWRIFSVKAVPAFDANQSIYQWVGVHTDITEQREAAQKIKESENYFRKLTDTVPAIIWITGPDGKCSYLNQNWYSYTGQTEEEALSFGWLNATHPDDKEETSRIFIEANEQRKSFMASYRLKVKSGDYRWAIDRGSPKFSDDGQYEGMIGTVVDVHEEKLAADKILDSEKQFNTLANNIQNLAWIADGEGWTYWYNQRWYDYTGTTLEEMKGWGWQKVHHPEHVTRVVDFLKQAWSINKPFELIFPLRSSDGMYRTFLTRAYPVCDRDGKIINWIGTNTDIEKQILEEEKKDEFISIASHEMKTPLTTAKAYLQMLELSLDENNEDANLYAKKASHSVNRLNDLIIDLLDISKISLGKLSYSLTNFNFNDMLDDTVENMQLISTTHAIIKTGKVENVIMGDKERLQQVVINLLTNAMKYSPEKEKVYVHVQQDNDMIKVSIKDKGIGIGKRSLNKIFDKYHRVEEHSIHYQGLGIGLYISNEIIQRHQGKLWAESELGKGSTFNFTLPLVINESEVES